MGHLSPHPLSSHVTHRRMFGVTLSARAIHVVSLLLFVTVSPAMAQTDWRTPAEMSGFKTTPGYDETLTYLERLAKAAPSKIRLERFGTTPEGRPMMLVVANGGGHFTPEAARSAKLPVI